MFRIAKRTFTDAKHTFSNGKHTFNIGKHKQYPQDDASEKQSGNNIFHYPENRRKTYLPDNSIGDWQNRNRALKNFQRPISVGIPGLEPGKAGPESAVLPLHHIPIVITCKITIFSISRKIKSEKKSNNLTFFTRKVFWHG